MLELADEGNNLEDKHEVYKLKAHTLMKRGEFQRALECFSKAISYKEDDVESLSCRSRCHLELSQTSKALEDAEKALTIDNKSYKSLYAKAEALYHRKEYELAMVFYHRGNRLRPDIEEFETGILKTKKSIEKGRQAPSKHASLSKKGNDVSSSSKVNSTGNRQVDRTQSRSGGWKRSSTRSEVNQSERGFLGELYGDRKFLEKLLNEIDLKSENGRSISQLAYSGLHFLDKRREFWRENNPKYSALPENQQRQLNSAGIYQRNVLKQLVKIEEELNEENYDATLKRSEKTLEYVQSLDDGYIDYREEILATIYTFIGIAHQDKGNNEQAIEYHHKTLGIANDKGLHDIKSRALDNLGQVYAKSKDFSSAMQAWKDKEPLCTSASDCTWICHEIGRCCMELQMYGDSIEYGEKSLEAAVEASNENWQLNALVLIAQSNVKLKNYQEAQDKFVNALEVAKRVGDEKAIRALHRSLIEMDKNMKTVGEQAEERKDISTKRDTDGSRSRSPSMSESDYDENTFESANDVTVTSDDSS